MLIFILKRIAQASLVMLIISFIAFSIQSKLGDPISELVGISASAEEKEAFREKLGLNDTFLVQYARFLKKALPWGFRH